MAVTLDRREMLAALASLVAAGAARADAAVRLEWEDLLPEGARASATANALRGVPDRAPSDVATRQPQSTGVRTDWNGRTVALDGFVVPLEHSGDGVTAFILVPYVGACVHVPPPPANQLVFVTTGCPWQSDGLFEPVTVTGTFGTAPTSTQLAEIGYALSADRIQPFSG